MDTTAHTEHHQHTGHASEPTFSTKAIWRTFWILLIITCVELTVGMFVAPHFHNFKLAFNILYIILTLAKAFYIVAEFMHLGHEIRNLVMTIIVPLMLFIWFVISFLWDGDSYLNARNAYDPYKREQNKVKVAPAHGHEAKKPGTVE